MIKTLISRACIIGTLGLTAIHASADVTIENPYARAVPPGQMNSASFMVIHNTDSKAVSLLSASSSVAETVELHNHINEDGIMKMRQVDQIKLPAEGKVSLQPGGYHVMLIGLKQDLVEGTEIDMTLTFSDGSNQQLMLPVQKIMAGMTEHKHHH
ncbi:MULTISPECIES: copper chaperone PCu(A)C [unclassified Neptuniibacter]|jgi:copper(I)-binding protein|uniref:copper chaperone PCu(A)C n=1 Tax=unclassified Neptuniibacter TaxID=2630693 RepID=UPI0026E2BE33|nr:MULTISPECIES: copper chaperone PCu(A)C [unclassified Neptuniibacter]MDO6513645.1 copper chaperone PCu(A)C [Neptuniibacter sp. 2_MG-2023]MDO6593786.1 copper chaperone PCu(A)C [Neptuniibacter sp. 1_MG-2023]